MCISVDVNRRTDGKRFGAMNSHCVHWVPKLGVVKTKHKPKNSSSACTPVG